MNDGQTTQILRCKSTAAMPTLDKLCNQEGYEPFSRVYGGAWQHAWEVVGPCSGTIAPTTACPTSVGSTPGCPSIWVAGAEYVAGSLVSMNCQILRCKSTAAMPTLDKLCNQAGYEPFSTAYGGAWQHAWEVVGPCAYTMTPTSAPVTPIPTTTATPTTTAAPTTDSPSKAPVTPLPTTMLPTTSPSKTPTTKSPTRLPTTRLPTATVFGTQWYPKYDNAGTCTAMLPLPLPGSRPFYASKEVCCQTTYSSWGGSKVSSCISGSTQ